MKKLTAILLITLSPVLSLASTASISCQNLTGDDKSLVLFINDSKVIQLKVQSQGSLPKVLKAHEIRNDGTISLYSLVGHSALLEIQSKVLDGLGGRAKFSGERFECDSN